MKSHSKIGLVMNSSTTIYSWVAKDAIKNAYQALQEIMNMSGQTVDVKEVFDVQCVYDKDYIYDRIGYSGEWEQYVEVLGIDSKTAAQDEKITEDFVDFINDLISDGTMNLSKEETGDHCTILVKSKITGKLMDLGGLLGDLFEVEAGYD